MQISPLPAFQQQHVSRAGSTSSSAWAQGFREHISQDGSRTQTSTHSPQAFQQMARYGGGAFRSNFAQPDFAPITQANGKQRMVEHFDEAAFANAFDQAHEDMLVEQNVAQMQQPLYNTTSNTAQFDTDLTEVHDPVASALLSEPLEEVQQAYENDDDALAATAKELLEKVEHNKTDKFKNSQFLSLMRKLRDREMKVDGDHMIETVRADPKSPSAAHDSTYGSGAETPILNSPGSQSIPSLDQSIPTSSQSALTYKDQELDHWESPYL